MKNYNELLIITATTKAIGKDEEDDEHLYLFEKEEYDDDSNPTYKSRHRQSIRDKYLTRYDNEDRKGV